MHPAPWHGVITPGREANILTFRCRMHLGRRMYFTYLRKNYKYIVLLISIQASGTNRFMTTVWGVTKYAFEQGQKIPSSMIQSSIVLTYFVSCARRLLRPTNRHSIRWERAHRVLLLSQMKKARQAWHVVHNVRASCSSPTCGVCVRCQTSQSRC